MYDIAIIGGGINGCGIARDAAGRGLKVLLLEKGDLASATSSASTKLIHGGLRYLEHYEFRLVREALSEREVLWGMAPHIIRPMRFVLPHHAALRPAWLLRLGLFIYDHLGGRHRLPPTRTIELRTGPLGAGLARGLVRGFEYSDCWVDDARLVVLNAVDAAERGADVRPRTELVAAERENDHWRLTARAEAGGEARHETSRILVNAAGPWVGALLATRLGLAAKARMRLVKGSHIVVPRLFPHDRAFIFQGADGRIVFAIPYEGDFTLIGTTDVEHWGDPGDVAIDEAEATYLCNAVSAYLERPVTVDRIVWAYAGVRPLLDDGAAAHRVSRDFSLELDAADGQAPLLSVFGGKITTYRRLAEAALGALGPWIGDAGPGWTRNAALPGGDFPCDGLDALVGQIAAAYPLLPASLVHRLVLAYGTRTQSVLVDGRTVGDLGRHFGADLYEREVEWLVTREWARSAADILWRRSKLGLRLSRRESAALEAWLTERVTPASPLPSQ